MGDVGDGGGDSDGDGVGGMRICAMVPGGARGIDVMGLSVRTPRWRYTAWYAWDKHALAPVPTDGPSPLRELYDHRGDDGLGFDQYENVNLAYREDRETVETVRRLSQLLKTNFKFS